MTKERLHQLVADFVLENEYAADGGLAEIRNFAEKHGVQVALLKYVGPGGWPLVRFVGRRVELQEVIDAYETRDNVSDLIITEYDGV